MESVGDGMTGRRAGVGAGGGEAAASGGAGGRGGGGAGSATGRGAGRAMGGGSGSGRAVSPGDKRLPSPSPSTARITKLSAVPATRSVLRRSGLAPAGAAGLVLLDSRSVPGPIPTGGISQEHVHLEEGAQAVRGATALGLLPDEEVEPQLHVAPGEPVHGEPLSGRDGAAR